MIVRYQSDLVNTKEMLRKGRRLIFCRTMLIMSLLMPGSKTSINHPKTSILQNNFYVKLLMKLSIANEFISIEGENITTAYIGKVKYPQPSTSKGSLMSSC